MRGREILCRLGMATVLAAATASAVGVVGVAPAAAKSSNDGHGSFGGGDGLSGSHGSRHHGHGGHFGPPPASEGVQPIVTGLNQPKKLTVAPDGSLVVALSGDGSASTDCTTGEEPSCLDESGAIDRVTPWGKVTPLIQNLPSVSSEGGATGPAEARFMHGHLEVLFQDTNIDPSTGEEPYGPAGQFLGDLVRFPLFFGSPHIQAAFGPFEAQNNPDGGEGTAIEIGAESAIDSDPYSFVPYHGGIVVADAAGDDLLFVSPSGAISVLAVLPTIPEIAAPGSLGPQQTTPIEIQAQPVPDSVAVGPDGALYVGELGGAPFDVGASSVYRVVPGHAPTLYAGGFTAIGDIAFDPRGRLLVLEIDQQGLNDPALAGGGLPTPGAIIGVHSDGTQTLLASTGLEFSTGMAVTQQGSVYVSNYGVLPASGGPGGLSGEVASVGLPSSWTHTPW
jgi:hypothetical protein